MKTWTVEFYETRDGKSPVKAFLDALPAKDRLKLVTVIAMLENSGTRLRMPHAKAMEGEKNLFELRSQVGTNIQRVFYFHFTGKTFILLHGFTKKTHKTPQREFDIAVKRREDYLKRYKEEPPNA